MRGPEELADLGRRAVACKGRWVPGMLYRGTAWSASHPSVRVRDDDDHIDALKSGVEANTAAFQLELSDPATLGVVEHVLLWEAWPSAGHIQTHWTREGDGSIYIHDAGPGPEELWSVEQVGKAEALVLAMEAGQ